MTKILSALVTAIFAVASLSSVAFAGDKTQTVAEACKGKKAGDVVTVDGNKVTCPDATKADTMKK